MASYMHFEARIILTIVEILKIPKVNYITNKGKVEMVLTTTFDNVLVGGLIILTQGALGKTASRNFNSVLFVMDSLNVDSFTPCKKPIEISNNGRI